MRLLDLLPDTPANRQRRVKLLLDQALVFARLSRLVEYRDLLYRFEEVVAERGGASLGAFCGRLGHCCFFMGDFHRAEEYVTQAIDRCELAGNPLDAAHAVLVLQLVRHFQGQSMAVIELTGRVLGLTATEPHSRLRVWTLCVTSDACSQLGRWNEAISAGTEALRIGRESNDSSSISAAAVGLAIPYVLSGNLDKALEYTDVALAAAPTPVDRMQAVYIRGVALLQQGDAIAAIPLLEEAMGLLRTTGYILRVHNEPFVAQAYLQAGRTAEAAQLARETVELAERCGANLGAAMARSALGEALAITGSWEEAAACFERSIALLRPMGNRGFLGLAHAGYGRLHRRLGNIAEARAHYTRALGIFEEIGHLLEPGRIRGELAAL